MNEHKMWFGNRAYMQWVACPEVGADYNASAATRSGKYLNGGAFHRRSLSAAKTFGLSWSLTSRDTVRKITDYFEGVYGDGLIYWSDPFTMDRNVLPQSFATPALGGHDAVILDGSETRPQIVPTDANQLGYPSDMAIYEVSPTAQVRTQYVPIPPGHAAWVGAHGVPSAGGVSVQKTSGTSSQGAPVIIPVAPLDSPLVAHQFPATGANSGIEVSLQKGATVGIAGLIVQVLPAGVQPTQDRTFISGQGASGCEFSDAPAKEAYSAAMDLVGLSAELVEVGQWL